MDQSRAERKTTYAQLFLTDRSERITNETHQSANQPISMPSQMGVVNLQIVCFLRV